MTDVVLFHHVLGKTRGVDAFAQALRDHGHVVYTPDLFDGRTFSGIDAGIAFVDELGFGTVVDRGVAAVDDLPREVVYAGFSLGVLPAQRLAQTRPGARGALLFESCVPPDEFAAGWPSGVPVQIHGMDADPFFAGEGDLDAARQLVAGVDASTSAELFLYPGGKHLFADGSLESYDADAAALLIERVLAFLSLVDAGSVAS